MLPDLFVRYVARFLFGNRLVPMTVDIEFFIDFIIFGIHAEFEIFHVILVCVAGLVGKEFPSLIVLVRRRSFRALAQSLKIFGHYCNCMFAAAGAHRAGAARIESTALFRRLLTPDFHRVAFSAWDGGQQPAVFRDREGMDAPLPLVDSASFNRSRTCPFAQIVPTQDIPTLISGDLIFLSLYRALLL